MSADRFLALFARRAAEGEAATAVIEDPDGLAEAARQDSEALAEALEAAVKGLPPVGGIVHSDGLATAVFGPDGDLIEADERFSLWFGDDALSAEALREATKTRRVVRAPAVDRDGRETVLAVAGAKLARAWPLPPSVRRALEAGQGRHAALGVCVSRAAAVQFEAARAFGLTPLQARVIAALAEHGRLPKVAQELGLAYEVVREAVGEARRKSGARRQTDLIRRILELGVGAWRPPANPAHLLVDVFGVTPRQARLAVAVSEGMTRAQAARSVGVGDAVAKDELSAVFQATHVESAAELARLIVETSAVAVLTGVTGATLTDADDRTEPLRFIPRPVASGRPEWIAVSDYGPAGGKPVLILHASATSRHVARSFVRDLQAAGYRPVAIDRPGFGLTDPAHGDTHEQAAADLVTVCDALGFKTVRLFARSGSWAVMKLCRRQPERFQRIVTHNCNVSAELVGPRGLLGGLAHTLVRSPRAAAALMRLFSAIVHTGHVERALHDSMASSPADKAVFADPAQVADYLRSVRFLAVGRTEGMLAEQGALTMKPPPPPLADASNWTLLVCGTDPLFDGERVLASDLKFLPGAKFVRLPDAGRFPHLTHPQAVIAALDDA